MLSLDYQTANYLPVTASAVTGLQATVTRCGIQTLIALSNVTATKIHADSEGAKKAIK